MKVGLYDVDSKMPNLALMKLSAYHKAMGDTVEFYAPLFDGYDKIYASKIFNFSDDSYIDPERMVVGGSGYDLSVKLPSEVEAIAPDYSLYNWPHSIGFTARGCRLRCDFCVVPQKEGKPSSNNTIEEIWTNRGSDFVILMDNDFFGNPEWADRIKEINALNLKVCFSQGINIRNLRIEQAAALRSVRFCNISGKTRQLHFAWDDVMHEKLIHKGIATCIEAGIKPYEMAFFVLIGFNSTHEEDLHRVMILKDYGCDPFVMKYNKSDPYEKKFARWVNHRAIFQSVAWEDYK